MVGAKVRRIGRKQGVTTIDIPIAKAIMSANGAPGITSMAVLVVPARKVCIFMGNSFSMGSWLNNKERPNPTRIEMIKILNLAFVFIEFLS